MQSLVRRGWGGVGWGGSYLGWQVAAVGGGEFVKGLGTHVAAAELVGQHGSVGREGLLHGAADGGGLCGHLQHRQTNTHIVRSTKSPCYKTEQNTQECMQRH